jgi:uncharacterized RDD family membrane protein YckC
MPTGFDLLSGSKPLRIHWMKRSLAALIDLAIVVAPISLAFVNEARPDIVTAGIVSGIGLFAYSTLLEGFAGQTWGKRILGLSVVCDGDRHSFVLAAIRSVPKFFWYVFLPFDALAGLAMHGDPRRRFTDHIAHTKVIALPGEKRHQAIATSSQRSKPSRR